MAETLLHYFTGTNNTLLLAERLAAELMNRGDTCVVHSIDQGIPGALETYKQHIFLFPIYATAMPHAMQRYILSLPSGHNVRAVVLSTNGTINTRFRDGYQGWALHQARLVLALKGYKVFYSETLDMPHNVTLAIPPRNHIANAVIMHKATVRISEIADQIVMNIYHQRGFFILNALWSIPFGLLYTWIGRRVIGKLFAADTSCTACGKCVKECPVQAIHQNNHDIWWAWDCEGCLKCLNLCPNSSVQISLFRVIALLAIMIWNPLFSLLVPQLLVLKIGIFKGFMMVIVELCCMLLAYGGVDQVLRGAARIRLIRRLTAWGFTSLYGRYNAKRDSIPSVDGKN